MIRSGRPPYRLRLWAIHAGFANSAYMAPEQIRRTLSGVCEERATEVGKSGDPTHRVFTTPVVSWWPAEQVAETASGSRYVLVGPPEPEYAAWCAERGIDPTAILSEPPK